MATHSKSQVSLAPASPPKGALPSGPEIGPSIDHLGNRFVHASISSRAGGLSIGINMNPDKACNFNCIYCAVDRSKPSREPSINVAQILSELETTLEWACSGGIRKHPSFEKVPECYLKLQHVALTGDGEPTLCNDFVRIVEGVVHLRAGGRFPFFKLSLMTNASGLQKPQIIEGLAFFTARDEIWAKFEAGTQAAMNRVNQPDCSLETIKVNILNLARKRPVIIQALFPAIDESEPSTQEINDYALRLSELKNAGAQISLVQIYSANRQPYSPRSRHLPLRTLNLIAERVRQASGLKVQVF